MPLPPTIAVIDIGTNSTKLLVARVDASGGIETLRFARSTTRLGRGMSASGRITRDGIDSTAAAVEHFARAAARLRVAGVFTFSTFALRRARNGATAARAIERRTGIPLRVLGGREEARFAYLSASTCLSKRKRQAIVLDVGGGSTEFVLARSGDILAARSLPLGALHLTEAFLHSDPVGSNEYAAMIRRVRAVVARTTARFPTIDPQALDLVVSGGAATTAAAMARGLPPRETTGARLTRADLAAIERACVRLKISQRKQLPGLPSDRADIILAGVAIVVAFMDALGKRVIRVNGGGVREGALIHLARNNLRW